MPFRARVMPTIGCRDWRAPASARAQRSAISPGPVSALRTDARQAWGREDRRMQKGTPVTAGKLLLGSGAFIRHSEQPERR